MPPKKNKAFLAEVQKYERAWGNESYTGRPSLEQIMDAKVVAFWYPSGTDVEMHTTVTLHPDLKAIDAYVQQLVVHTKVRMPVVRLAKVFLNQHQVKIRSVEVKYTQVLEK